MTLAWFFTVVSAIAFIVHVLVLNDAIQDWIALRQSGLNGILEVTARMLVRIESTRSVKMLLLFLVGINAVLNIRVGLYLLLVIPPLSLFSTLMDWRSRHQVVALTRKKEKSDVQ